MRWMGRIGEAAATFLGCFLISMGVVAMWQGNGIANALASGEMVKAIGLSAMMTIFMVVANAMEARRAAADECRRRVEEHAKDRAAFLERAEAAEVLKPRRVRS